MPKTEIFNRDEVLNNACSIFHLKGYNATSMQDLVDATGLNRSSIYNSFGNKLNLYLECLKLYQEKYVRATSKVLLKTNSPLEAISSILDFYIGEITNDKNMQGCMIANCKSEMANQDKTIQNFLNQNQTSTLVLFEDLIKEGQQLNLFNSKQSAKTYALFLFSTLQGLRMTGILLNKKKDLQSIAYASLQSLI